MEPGPRILIVEDELIVARDIAAMLQKAGYVVAGTAARGEDAAAQAKAERPDLVLMDIRLKGAMDGIEAARRVRQEHGVPVVFLTAHTDEATLQRAKHAEPYGYLLKPFDGQELRAAIEVALHKHRAEIARAAATEAQARLAAIVESTDDAIMGLALDGAVTSWNPAARRLFGYGKAEVLDRPVGLLIPVQRRSEEEVLLRRVRAGERVEHYETELVRKDGGTIVAAVTLSPVRDGTGRLVGASKIVRDITVRKHAEAQRRALEEQASELAHLREMDAMKTRFINAAAHELFTPLTPIQMQLQLLRRSLGPDPSEAQSRALEVIQRNFDRLEALVRDLLEAFRMGAGRMQLRPDLVDLGPLAEETAESFAAMARERGVRLLVRATPGVVVPGDRPRLGQVLYNLLSNALKFTPPGGTIEVEVAREDARSVVRVRDSGCGFDPSEAEALFQPFSQLKAGFAGTGSGLGLYVCKGIVSLHGGRIWAESPGPGRGATFAFAVPLAEGEAGQFEGVPAHRRRPA